MTFIVKRFGDTFKIQSNAMRIGWDFPFAISEMQNRFGLRGYVAAYILPEGFETSCPGVEFAEQKEAYIHAGYTHWTILYDGKYYDPEFGLIEGEYTYGKMTSFLGIYQ